MPSRRRPFELLFQAQAEAGEGMAALQTAERALARTFLDAFVEAHTLQGAADPVQAGSEAVTRADSLRAFIPVLRQSHVVATRPLAEVLPKLGDRHVLLYFATAEAMWLIQVAEQRVRLERLATSIAELQLLVDRFLRDPGDASAADELGTLLLPADVVLSKTELTLISTGPIAGLPFAALRRAGRTLVRDHVVHYVPSLSALAAIAEASTDGGGAPVVIGDARGDLPGARAEAVAVANELRVAAFLGAQASRDAVRAADRARVLHMAVHGGIGIQGAWLQLHDGELTSSDVLQWSARSFTKSIARPILASTDCGSISSACSKACQAFRRLSTERGR